MAKIIYPIGIQTFSEIREKGLLYVDKTEYVSRLVGNGKYVFLSRPRRFGKSLLLSTIKEFFSGRRDLFEGLAISRENHDWEKYPVLHLDLTGSNFNEPEGLFSSMNGFFEVWEDEYGVERRDGPLPERFRKIILAAYEKTGKQVVILIDEYDKPLLETVDNPPLQQEFKNTLRGIYGNLKRMDAHIRFAMLTGVTKFGHLSIFSDLNNLQDISMNKDYAGICGITTEELHKYFEVGVRNLAEDNNLTIEEAYRRLRCMYDGYHFSPSRFVDVYNPFSLLNAFAAGEFGDYWFQTGTPTFLVKMIKVGNIPVAHLDNLHTTVRALTDVSFDLGNYIPVLYQSGYLTIKEYDREFGEVTLGFPNREVASGFLDHLLPYYTSISQYNTAFEVNRFIKDVRAARSEDFMVRLQSLFADFQYDSFELRHLEQHYQDVIFILFKLMGFYTRVEYKTASGRIDLVVKTTDYIYVMEFKMDRTAEEALAQIDTKDYLLPFKADGRKVIKIGANFDSGTRTLASWVIEEG